MKDTWMCADCKSANTGGQRRCYRCHVPRATGEMTEATAAITTASAIETRTVLAQAARVGAHYRPSWPIALLVVPLILVATGINFAQVDAYSAMIATNGQLVQDAVALDRFIGLSTAMFAAYLIAAIVWSVWIAVVVGNVPALTARWPAIGPIGSFFAAFIPFVNLKRPHTVVRSVLVILGNGRFGPNLVALAWWIAVLATYFAPTVVVFASDARAGSAMTLLTALNVRIALLVPAAVLAIAVVMLVEREQRNALGRRASAVFVAEGGTAQAAQTA